MASGFACEPGPDAPSLSVAVERDGAVSPRSGRPFETLRGRSNFKRVYRTGVRHRASGVTVISARGSGGPGRVGLVAGRRVGGAVARNRAKRRLRAATARSGVPDGVDSVLVATPAVLEEDFDTIVDWVRQGFRAAGEGDRR